MNRNPDDHDGSKWRRLASDDFIAVALTFAIAWTIWAAAFVFQPFHEPRTNGHAHVLLPE